uniref:Uncharacterized protein n=1 Tax=Lactuca sativa TaxID=4236 RepID=A0A9R1XID4_LACSA|nr:hypothetical protein LSAT_V11C300118250 [Lactuca sativa]
MGKLGNDSLFVLQIVLAQQFHFNYTTVYRSRQGLQIFVTSVKHVVSVECALEEAFSIVGDNIIFVSGSPFSDVEIGFSFNSLIIFFL